MESNTVDQQPKLQKWFRLQEVIEMTSLSSPTIYRMMAAGTFPKSVQLGRKAVRWRESDLLNWQAKAGQVEQQ